MTNYLLTIFAIALVILLFFGKKIRLAIFYKRHRYCPKCKTEMKKKTLLRKNIVSISFVHLKGPGRPGTVEEALYCPKCRYEIIANPLADPNDYR